MSYSIMKRFSFGFLFFAFWVCLASLRYISNMQGPRPNSPDKQRVSRWIQNLCFVDVDGKKGKLSDFKKCNGLVVASIGSSCPISKRFAPTLSKLKNEYFDHGSQFIFVDSIMTTSARINLKKLNEFQGPKILDEEKIFIQEFKPQTSTEVFLLDKARTYSIMDQSMTSMGLNT